LNFVALRFAVVFTPNLFCIFVPVQEGSPVLIDERIPHKLRSVALVGA